MEPEREHTGRSTTTSMSGYGISCGDVTRCPRGAPSAFPRKLYSGSWEYSGYAMCSWDLVRESTVKPVGKPDARDGHVRFDERGRKTGRRPVRLPAPRPSSTLRAPQRRRSPVEGGS